MAEEEVEPTRVSLEVVLGNFDTVLLLFVRLALQNEGVREKGARRNG